ncbi:MAG: threonine/serine exporter family protein [Niameybacter sp.]|uniref:threonine/serine ThrE exporter family protein n=1 Tax=Niameybacter sp. TaxID=2033640 RepID=UPI002FC67B19
MEQKNDNESVLAFAVNVGEIMLRSGAETYRVEDTICRLLAHHHFDKVDTFVTPTVVMATIKNTDSRNSTTLTRIKNRSTRMDKIEKINQLSRDYVDGILSLEEATTTLKSIDDAPSYSPKMITFATAFSSGFFSLMFNGGITEFLIACVIGACASTIQHHLRNKEIVNYLILFMVSLFIGSIVAILNFFVANIVDTEAVVIGSIMPLVPGLAFTNGIRDTIGDELLSGISRLAEALFIAVAIAAGVGIPMSIGFYLGGLL